MRGEVEVLIEKIGQSRIAYLPAGFNVFSEGDVADSLFFIKSGKVDLGVYLAPQKITISITQISAGRFLGEHCVGPYPLRQNRATTLEASVLVRVEKNDMVKALQKWPELRKAFMDHLLAYYVTLEKICCELRKDAACCRWS
jgi:CRP-like cAMP-binding protein